MDYQGPEPADLENVRTLNTAFLDWLTIDGRAIRALPPEATGLLACPASTGRQAGETGAGSVHAALAAPNTMKNAGARFSRHGRI